MKLTNKLITQAKRFKPKYACEFTFTQENSITDSYKFVQDLKSFNKRVFSMAPKWISRNIHVDGGIWEAPSPVCSTHELLIEKWRQFNKLVKGLGGRYHDEDLDSGGGHIHMCMPPAGLGEEFKRRFIKNLIIEISNNPWLVWAFNSSADNVNALLPINVMRELASEDYYTAINMTDKYKSLRDFLRGEYAGYCTNYRNESAPLKWRKYLAIREHVKKTRIKYLFGGYRIEYYISQFHLVTGECATNLNKKCAINLSTTINTIEFRFFDMPITEKQMALHLKVANILYKRAMDYTISGKEPKIDQTTLDTTGISRARAIRELVDWCKREEIDQLEIAYQIKSLKLRYSVENRYQVLLKDYLK